METGDLVLNTAAYGMLRIFLRAGERPQPRHWRDRLFGTPSFMQILEEARNYGLPHGTAKQCVHGFMNEAHIHGPQVEVEDRMLPLYVELFGTREALEGFCLHAARMLQGKTIVFKEVETWTWQDGATEMTVADMEAELEAAEART